MKQTEKKQHISEEPAPGWLRFETEGSKPWFKSPVPRTVIRTSTMLKEYLDKEHKKNRMLDVDGSEFSFKRRYGLQEKYPRNKDSLSEPEVCDVWLNVFKST